MMQRPLKPRGFKPAGEISFAELSNNPGFYDRKKRGMQGAKANGLRYERRVHTYFLDRYPEHYTPAPWLKFYRRREANPRFCEPDGLLVDLALGLIFVCEIKYSHTPLAWWQVNDLYIPVLRKILGEDWRYGGIEICHHASPTVQDPVSPTFIEDLREARVDQWNLHLLRI